MLRERYPALLETAAAHLRAADPVMAEVIERVGPCRLEPAWERSPFESLVRAVAYQQLHGRAAAAILGRVIGLFDTDFPSPQQLLSAEEEALRGAGLSRAKLAAIRDIAAKAAAGVVPSRAEAESLSDEVLIERLVSIRGVGRWTVEMLLIFTLGRLDVFPCDDFGVKSGLCGAYALPAAPKRGGLVEFAEPWRPYRSVASWYLWRVADTRVPD